jgi:magnesium transporter
MSVVASFVYCNGQRVRPVSLDAPESLQLQDSEFVWIGLMDPSEEELRALQERFNLHPLAVEDAFKAHQLPKVDVYGEQLFVVTRTAHLDGDQITYGETHVFMGRGHIITVRHGSARAHSELRDQLEATPLLLRHGVDYVLHAVLDFIVDGYLPIVETIEGEVLEMEHRALDAFLEREEINRIFNLRRELMRFRRLLGPMGEVANRLEHLDSPLIDAEVRPYFRDVLDHVRHVEAMVAGLLDVLTSVFEISTLLEQQRQGASTRQLASWAAILAVPTAVAGIYGMNFRYMPELTWRYGYFLIVAAITVACLLLYWRFKQTKWL